MKQNKRKTAFVPCQIFKHDGTTLTVGITDVTMNAKPSPSEVYCLVEGYGNGEDDPEALATFTPDRAEEIAEALLRFARLAKEAKDKAKVEPADIKNLNSIELKIERAQVTITDCHGEHKGDDEIVLYVPNCSEYDTDFIQDDCAMLHFSPAQAKALARKLLRLATGHKS